MGEQGFRVQPEALRSYGRLIQAQSEQIAQIRSSLASVSLASDDFGKLPNAQNLFQAYEEHAQAEQQNFADLIEILGDTAQGLDYSASNYESQDSAVEAVYGGDR
ncbi:hypothetical protein KCMC57_up22070 [Kitasatospora sp. CMC57]|uniref:Uncharacterized protein n=1 Tax=Kitasatospora sp. CMC57 TaxID=3231513 RepID=A0AB33JZS6_9ACTN